jgi:hypothetical protein
MMAESIVVESVCLADAVRRGLMIDSGQKRFWAKRPSTLA